MGSPWSMVECTMGASVFGSMRLRDSGPRVLWNELE